MKKLRAFLRYLRYTKNTLSGLWATPDRTNPDFMIIGAQKSGTTTLRYHLSDHPEISPPRKTFFRE